MRTRYAAVVVVFLGPTIVAIAAALAAAQRRDPAPAPATQPAVAEKRLTAAHLIALRNGGELRLAPGVYTSRTPVDIRDASGFALVGEGVTIRAPVRIADCRNFRISGITFDGARATLGDDWKTPTVRMTRCSDFTAEHCRFKDARGDHLYLELECREGLFANCRFDDAWRNGISVISGHHLRFDGITVDTVHGQILGAGMDIEGNADDPEGCNHDITVSNSTFRNCAETGVRITNGREPYRIDVTGNTFENCPTGVLVGGRDCRVRGNIFRDVKRPGGRIGEEVRAQVYLNGTRAGGLMEVTGNRFERLSGIGGVRVHPGWTGPVLVSGNVFSTLSGKNTNAVSVYSADAVVTGNVVFDVQDGIGIGISGRGATVANNVLRGGAGAGAIWSDVEGGSYAGNHVSGWPTAQSLPKGNEVK